MNALFEGIALGLSLAFVFGFGPAFFALVQTALQRGFSSGVLLAIGIFLNDVIIVVLGLLGSVHVIKGSENYQLMGIIGGALLIVFGLFTLTRKNIESAKSNTNGDNPHAMIFLGKGFVLNLLNPFVWIFWLTVIVSATATYKADTFDLILFFSGTLGVVVITDISKVFMASRLSRIITGSFLVTLNKIAGVALVLFGMFMIIRGVLNF
jgi:threonine/homoserine/homoserine lactone efflux protein